MNTKTQLELKAAAFDLLVEYFSKSTVPIGYYNEITKNPVNAQKYFQQDQGIVGEDTYCKNEVVIQELRIAFPLKEGNISTSLINQVIASTLEL